MLKILCATILCVTSIICSAADQKSYSALNAAEQPDSNQVISFEKLGKRKLYRLNGACRCLGSSSHYIAFRKDDLILMYDRTQDYNQISVQPNHFSSGYKIRGVIFEDKLITAQKACDGLWITDMTHPTNELHIPIPGEEKKTEKEIFDSPIISDLHVIPNSTKVLCNYYHNTIIMDLVTKVITNKIKIENGINSIIPDNAGAWCQAQKYNPYLLLQRNHFIQYVDFRTGKTTASIDTELIENSFLTPRPLFTLSPDHKKCGLIIPGILDKKLYIFDLGTCKKEKEIKLPDDQISMTDSLSFVDNNTLLYTSSATQHYNICGFDCAGKALKIVDTSTGDIKNHDLELDVYDTDYYPQSNLLITYTCSSKFTTKFTTKIYEPA